jgi:hypothetical protein
MGGKKLWSPPLHRIRPLLPPQMNSIFLLSCYNDLSWYFVLYNWSIFHCSFFCKSVHQLIACRYIPILPLFCTHKIKPCSQFCLCQRACPGLYWDCLTFYL